MFEAEVRMKCDVAPRTLIRMQEGPKTSEPAKQKETSKFRTLSICPTPIYDYFASCDWNCCSI